MFNFYCLIYFLIIFTSQNIFAKDIIHSIPKNKDKQDIIKEISFLIYGDDYFNKILKVILKRLDSTQSESFEKYQSLIMTSLSFHFNPLN